MARANIMRTDANGGNNRINSKPDIMEIIHVARHMMEVGRE